MNLRKALKMEGFPEIRYWAQKYILAGDGATIHTSQQLTIAGVAKNVGFGAKMIPLSAR